MGIVVGIVAFISEYLDSGLGMGYGTALSPILILLGYDPLAVIPAVLVSQLFTDIAACFFHHNLKNVDLKIGSPDFKAASLLGAVSSVGVVVAVLIAVKIPKYILTSYIGILVFIMGFLVIVTIKRPMRFSWGKLTAVSFLAAFNKGISGGGYGPLVMGGQLLSGVQVKNSVGISAFAEAITCLVGFITYILSHRAIDWKLVTVLTASAVLAVPFAALTVKNAHSNILRRYVGILIMILGLCTLLVLGK